MITSETPLKHPIDESFNKFINDSFNRLDEKIKESVKQVKIDHQDLREHQCKYIKVKMAETKGYLFFLKNIKTSITAYFLVYIFLSIFLHSKK